MWYQSLGLCKESSRLSFKFFLFPYCLTFKKKKSIPIYTYPKREKKKNKTVTYKLLLLLLSHFSRGRLLATAWTAAHQALHPWDFPGKSIGVGYHCLLQTYKLPNLKTKRMGEVDLYLNNNMQTIFIIVTRNIKIIL